MISKILRQLVLILGFVCFGFGYAQDRDEWMKLGAQRLKEAVAQRHNLGVAKNVILFIGDGMGVSTVTAMRILKGQREGFSGEEYRLHMEKMPYTGLVKTYNTDQQTPDSAGTATAFLTGVKTRAGVLGVDNRVEPGDCTYLDEASLESIADWVLAEGKSVGIVTTARVTHATPAAAYANTPNRMWESDADMVSSEKGGRGGRNCDFSSLKDIARQLVEDNHNIQVVLGGGRRAFMDNNTRDPVIGKSGLRADGGNLIQAWERTQEAKGARYAYVWNRQQLNKVDDNTEYLLGLFDYSHMSYDADRYGEGLGSQPSIAEMTAKAIQILRKNEKGFFLYVEGAKIDHGHHANLAQKALLEGIALDQAVKTATDLTSVVDTLTVVTADHSHVFNIGGYPPRGHPILEKVPDTGQFWSTPIDRLPMTAIVYGNGPGPGRDTDLTFAQTTDLNFQFPRAVPIQYETHAGEDVPVYAQGPMAHLLTGNWEQNVLAHVMAYASCVGPDKSHCTAKHQRANNLCAAAPSNNRLHWFLVLVVVVTGFSLVRHDNMFW